MTLQIVIYDVTSWRHQGSITPGVSLFDQIPKVFGLLTESNSVFFLVILTSLVSGLAQHSINRFFVLIKKINSVNLSNTITYDFRK